MLKTSAYKSFLRWYLVYIIIDKLYIITNSYLGPQESRSLSILKQYNYGRDGEILFTVA